MPGETPPQMATHLTARTKRLFLLILIVFLLSTAPFLSLCVSTHFPKTKILEASIPVANHRDEYNWQRDDVRLSEASVAEALWNFTYGGSDKELGSAVVECSSGGFAIAGVTKSYGAGNRDVWLVRTDANGSLLWSRTFGYNHHELSYSLVECSDGGFAIAGGINSGGISGWNAWLIRTDANGNQLWEQSYGDRSVNDRFRDVVECIDGGFALVGYTEYVQTGKTDCWLLRTANNGTTLWWRNFGGEGYEEVYSLVECSSEGFAITGFTTSFGAGGNDVWLIRTNANGNLLWDQTYGNPPSDWEGPEGRTELGYSIIECASGDFVITGVTNSYGLGGNDVWLIRTDQDGAHLWNQTFGGFSSDGGWDVIECSSGGFVITGFTHSYSAGHKDVWLVRTDANGNHLWDNTYGGAKADDGFSVIECNEGGFTISGFTKSYGAGEEDVWLIRVSDNGTDNLPPTWREPPNDQLAEFGMHFHYDLDAQDPAGIDKWWLNNTSHFAVNESGTISNTTGLGSIGTSYGLQISVNDSHNNIQSAHFQVVVGETTPPAWLEEPSDQFLMFGQVLHYQLNATDPSGIDYWTVNDTLRFSINNSGLLTSTMILPFGLYPLNVCVYDLYGNQASAIFTVNVGILPGGLTTIILVTAVVFFSQGVLFIVLLRQRKKWKEKR